MPANRAAGGICRKMGIYFTQVGRPRKQDNAPGDAFCHKMLWLLESSKHPSVEILQREGVRAGTVTRSTTRLLPENFSTLFQCSPSKDRITDQSTRVVPANHCRNIRPTMQILCLGPAWLMWSPPVRTCSNPQKPGLLSVYISAVSLFEFSASYTQNRLSRVWIILRGEMV
jgi:hypothetical protein